MGLKIDGAVKMIDGFVSAAIYVGLKVGSTEVSGAGYAREKIEAGSTGWTIASITSNSIREAKNKSKITFDTSTGAWGDVTKIGLYDSLSGGKELADFDLSNNPDEITQTGTVVEIAVGALKIQQPLT